MSIYRLVSFFLSAFRDYRQRWARLLKVILRFIAAALITRHARLSAHITHTPSSGKAHDYRRRIDAAITYYCQDVAAADDGQAMIIISRCRRYSQAADKHEPQYVQYRPLAPCQLAYAMARAASCQPHMKRTWPLAMLQMLTRLF